MIAPADCGPVSTPDPPYTGTLPASGTVTRQISHCLDDAYVTLSQTVNLYNGSPYLRGAADGEGRCATRDRPALP